MPSKGKNKAAVAVRHTLLVIIYHLLRDPDIYRELGGAYFDQYERHAVQRRLVRRLTSKTDFSPQFLARSTRLGRAELHS